MCVENSEVESFVSSPLCQTPFLSFNNVRITISNLIKPSSSQSSCFLNNPTLSTLSFPSTSSQPVPLRMLVLRLDCLENCPSRSRFYRVIPSGCNPFLQTRCNVEWWNHFVNDPGRTLLLTLESRSLSFTFDLHDDRSPSVECGPVVQINFLLDSSCRIVKSMNGLVLTRLYEGSKLFKFYR